MQPTEIETREHERKWQLYLVYKLMMAPTTLTPGRVSLFLVFLVFHSE